MPYVFLNPDGTQKQGAIVIVEHPTGVIYAQQCGGLSNALRTLEGFLVPVAGPDVARRISQWFQKRFGGNCYTPLVEWTDELISQLGETIRGISCWLTVPDGDDQPMPLKLDVDRMDECVEAWIPVLTPYGRGVLTLNNSD